MTPDSTRTNLNETLKQKTIKTINIFDQDHVMTRKRRKNAFFCWFWRRMICIRWHEFIYIHKIETREGLHATKKRYVLCIQRSGQHTQTSTPPCVCVRPDRPGAKVVHETLNLFTWLRASSLACCWFTSSTQIASQLGSSISFLSRTVRSTTSWSDRPEMDKMLTAWRISSQTPKIYYKRRRSQAESSTTAKWTPASFLLLFCF